MGIIIHILANSLAVLIAAKLIDGIVFTGSWVELLIAGAVVGLCNGVIRPIVKLISLPIIFLTLGLFSIIINIAILLLADNFISSLTINGFWPAFWGVLVISLINSIISSLVKKS